MRMVIIRTESIVKKLSSLLLASLIAGISLVGAEPARSEGSSPLGVYPAGIKPIAPYSPGILHGNLLFISGQIPHVNGAIPAEASDGKDDVKDQSKIVLSNVLAVLKEAGMDWKNVTQVTVYITDLGKFAEFNEIYGAVWKDAGISTPPARVTVEVSKLPGGKADAPTLIEISAMAAR